MEVTVYDPKNPTAPQQRTIQVPALIKAPTTPTNVELYVTFEGDKRVSYAHYEGSDVYYRITHPASHFGDEDGAQYAMNDSLYTLEEGDLKQTASRESDGKSRSILHNEAYVGKVTFKKRQWVKVPGTNKRRPKERDQSEVIHREHPERRIIEDHVWQAVQTRLAEVRSRYTVKRMTRSAPGARTAYPLSGLLICAACHSPMVISGGSRAEVDGKAVGPRTSYYRCGDSKKRGVCKNTLSVREDVVRTRIYGALREAVFTPVAVAHLRKRIAEHLGEAARLAQQEMKERLDRLARTEQRIRGLVTFIADGDHSSSVRDALRDLVAQALTERTAIQNIKDRMNAPVDLPTPDRVLERAKDLDAVLAADPVRAREALRRMFEGGRILLTPGDDGVYAAEATFLPLVALAQTTKPPAEGRGLGRGTAISCAGARGTLEHDAHAGRACFDGPQ